MDKEKIVLWILICGILVWAVECYWIGESYYNSRFTDIFDDTTDEYLIWSATVARSSNYYFHPSTYSGRSCTCNCDEEQGVVTGCTGDVIIKGYFLINITAESFETSVTKIHIYNIPTLTIIGDGAFDHLTELTELLIHRTGIEIIPDISNTKVWLLMLAENSIKLFPHNYTRVTGWPTTLTHVALQDNELDYLPDGYFSGSNIEFLQLSRNAFTMYPYTALRGMSALKHLSLSENQLTQISKQHLKPISFSRANLQSLNLSNNAIDYIQPGALAGLRELVLLELHNNALAFPVKGMFDNIPKLEYISLNKNKLERLYAHSFTNLPALRELRLHSQNPGMTNIYYNAFENINDELYELYVSNNALQSFPHQVLFEQPYLKLTKVFADRNGISDPLLYSDDGFPADNGPLWISKSRTFSKWNVTTPNIKELYLGSNGISELAEDAFCELEYLSILSLENNLLTDDNTSIPTELFKCHAYLYTLYLQSNYLQYIPKSISERENLRAIVNLYLATNKITVLESGSFSQHDNMTYLDLAVNLIVTIEDGAFNERIETIRLNNNQLRFTQRNTFSGLYQLRYLTLQHNRINHIYDATFKNCSAMRWLYLSSNELKFLNNSMFSYMADVSNLGFGNNEIAYIQPHTFSHMASLSWLDFTNNLLTEIPLTGVDFMDHSYTHLYFINNRLTSVPTDSFIRTRVTYLRLDSNNIAYIDTDAFVDCTITYLYLTNNPMKYVNSYAFNGGSYTHMYMSNMKIRYIPTKAFFDISGQEIQLGSNAIAYIEEEAFQVSFDKIDLMNNGLADILGQMFVTSSVTELDLRYNSLMVVLPLTFVDLSCSNLYLSNNKIAVYPGAALSVIGLDSIDLSDNLITTIDDGAFDAETGMRNLRLDNNLIPYLQDGLFDSLTSVETISLMNNRIAYLADALFNFTSELGSLSLTGNLISHIPQFGSPAYMIDSMAADFSDNPIQTVTADAFTYVEGGTVTLGTTDLQCTCAAYNALEQSVIAVAGTAQCGYPQTTVGGDFVTKVELFTYDCAPHDVTITQPSINVMNVTWNLNFTAVNVNSYANEKFYVSCWTPLTDPVTYLNETVDGLNTHTFEESDNVTDETLYMCAVHLKTGGAYTGSSDPAYIVTMLDTRKNVIAQLGDVELPVTFYDFSVTHDDFNGLDLSFTIDSPTYVPSPYGAWLAISDSPNDDSFSNWFRYVADMTYEFDGTVILSGVAAEETHRYSSTSFHPVDFRGFLDEGQTDCSNVPTNLGFTSAIRTGFVYQGNESIAISGGEMMWLYLNRKLVLQVFNSDADSPKVCKFINITEAQTSGGAFITPQTGIIVGGKCQLTGELPAESVQLQLELEERYHFTIFHVEREGCGSELMIDASSWNFIIDPLEEPPRDYIVYIDEDLYEGAIIETIFLSDTFSAGPPFGVNILRGNEAQHITLTETSTAELTASQTAEPDPQVFNYTSILVEGANVSFVECDGLAPVIPDANETGQTDFTINTETLYVKLNLSVDYEVSTYYTLILEIIDTLKVPPLTGQSTIKVKLNDINDNCPYLDPVDYYVVGVPPMSTSGYLRLNVTDTDSTINAKLAHVRTTPELYPLFSDTANQSLNLYEQIYPEWTNISYTVVITDGGEPTRGTTATITYQISNTCILDTFFGYIPSDQTVDIDSGLLSAVVPGYYSTPYDCTGTLGIEQAWIRDTLFTASSYQDYADPHRARLNSRTLTAIVEDLSLGFSGGWKPEIDDNEPWLQVDTEADNIFSQLALQGHADEDYWVTRLSLNYSQDGITWTQYMNTSSGNVAELTNLNMVDGNTTEYYELSPWIYARYLRIIVLDYYNNVSLRFELYGCQQEELAYWNRACLRCETSWYCIGDGEKLPCGRCDPVQTNSTCGRSPTEHSFGYRTECEHCPVGWTCEEGYGTPCPSYHYTECNTTHCQECTQCEPGNACRGGVKYQCIPGHFGTGYTDFCEPCAPGSFSNTSGADSCDSCPAGYSSNTRKNKCSVCSTNTYSTEGGLCTGCSDSSECPCMTQQSPCDDGVVCRNTGSGGHVCESCPPGYRGNGATCTDIDECVEYEPCWSSERCRNTEPGFQCLACPVGMNGTFEDAWAFNYTDRTFDLYNYERDELPYQTCDDINECDIDNGGCDPNAYCINTYGSYYCGFCKEGYMGSSIYGCYSNNFCTSNHPIHHHHCDINADCEFNGPGTYRCQCVNGWAGDGFICAEDPDQDGMPTDTQACTEYTCTRDNCPTIPNSGQEDNDGDWIGDVCDDDDDDDGISDLLDNCQYVYNRNQADQDGDLIGDLCDNCVSDANSDQSDVDSDGLGDICDSDADNDGVVNADDNCPLVVNAGHNDTDSDGIGDVCDNCPLHNNTDQIDLDESGVGDDCQTLDFDGDGVDNNIDNCINTMNSDQTDTDSDGIGDRCDEDIDNDGLYNDEDNCPYVTNLLQTDTDEDYIGDKCESDYDGDGVSDKYDDCISNPFITTTDFTSYTVVNLYPELVASSTSWLVLHEGKEVRQMTQTEMPAIMVADQKYDSIDYAGTIFANSELCDGYFGFVFGYQSNKKFYVAIWRHNHLNYAPDYAAGILGLQIKLVNAADTPSYTTAHGLWQSLDTTDVTLLYHDPWLRRWDCKTSYNFVIKHRPSIGLIRVVVKFRETLITDTGDIYDTTISGGRVGLLTFKQDFGIWSNLRVQCRDTSNRALQLYGNGDYVIIGEISQTQLDLLESFTISAWIQILSNTTISPIICADSDLICLYADTAGQLVAQHVSYTVTVTDANLTPDIGWTHILYRYDAELHEIYVSVNSTANILQTEIEPHSFNGTDNSKLYIGKSAADYFNGVIDDVRIYDIAVDDTDLELMWQQAAFATDVDREHMKVYYTMNDDTDYVDDLVNIGSYSSNGVIMGSPTFIDSKQHESRFQLTHPNNSRKRRSIYSYMAKTLQTKRQPAVISPDYNQPVLQSDLLNKWWTRRYNRMLDEL